MNTESRCSTETSRLLGVAAPLLFAVGLGLSPTCLGQVPAMLPEVQVSAQHSGQRIGFDRADRVDGRFTVVWRSDGQDSGFLLFPVGMAVDTHPREGTASNSNGVLEPGEFVVVETSWGGYAFGYYPPSLIHSVSGTFSSFTGPAGGIYSRSDQAASYGDIEDGGSKNCNDGSADHCYIVSVAAVGARPATHWDGNVHEYLSSPEPFVGGTTSWILHIGESFPDVPTDNQFYTFIETVFHNGVTAGCFGGGYCPGDPVTRAQMAVFLLKSKFGSAHVPPPCTGTIFSDVPCTGGPFDPWIEELASLGITGGCGGTLYCPGSSVTRQQVAAFLLKTREGSDYVPPACTGLFDDVPCTPGVGFPDWIEELSNRGITAGCSTTPAFYCPTTPDNRGEMAAFLTRTFGLVLYGAEP